VNNGRTSVNPDGGTSRRDPDRPGAGSRTPGTRNERAGRPRADVATWRAVRRAVALGCGIADSGAPTGEVDWRRFVELTRRHRVGALVHHGGWTVDMGGPGWVVGALARDAEEATLDALCLIGVQRLAVEILSSAAIDVVVLKGVALAQEAYGSAVARHAGDLDLLVDPDRVVDAVVVLREHGFLWHGVDLPSAMLPADRGLVALRRARDLRLVKEAALEYAAQSLDLHWRLADNPRLMPVAPGWLSDPRRVLVSGVVTPVLPIRPAWWHLLVHGACHRWHRLKWLADVAAMALAHPALLSAEALHATTVAGLERCVASGLVVADRLLGPFLPAAVRDWAASVRGLNVLVARSLAAAGSDQPRFAHVTRTGLPLHVVERMSLRPDRGYRAAELYRMLLEAGRRQLDPDPGLTAIASGPLHWLARTAGRRSG
jgi:hypothetical protein